MAMLDSFRLSNSIVHKTTFDRTRGTLDLRSGGLGVIRLRKFQAKAVPIVSGKHVQMHMKHFLHRGFTISQEEIDSFAFQPALP
jgi:hypothetical protein